MLFNINFTQKPQKNKPQKPVFLTIAIHGHGDFQILPSFMNDLEEERAMDLVKYIEAYKNGGER